MEVKAMRDIKPNRRFSIGTDTSIMMLRQAHMLG